MQTKILLLALTVAAFSSCSTTNKNTQTTDDVYYSPVNHIEERQNTARENVRENTRPDYEISMGIYDHRWRDFDNDYDYNKSPYHYCNCNCNNYGYYYNPSYHPWPVYMANFIPANSTPRKVNLNAYRGFHNIYSGDPKSGTSINWVKPSNAYNNSNTNHVRNESRQIITPSPNNNNNSNNNNTRTYTPSSSSSNNSGNSSGSNNSNSVTRPKRGG